jgi:16S rRNA (cytosine1402-N4)-methyltransferase
MNFTRHVPAFSGLIKNIFHLKKDDCFLDLTLGDGGHTQEALSAGARVVSLDVDIDSINRSTDFLKGLYCPIILNPYNPVQIPMDFSWLIIQSNFSEIGNLSRQYKLPLFNGILADLGTSQNQLADPERGFSFQSEGPLDMRLDQSLGVSAKDLVNALSEKELEKLLLLADEYRARSIAREIVRSRKIIPITTTSQLTELVVSVKNQLPGKINPATKTFMALRMAVNLERDSLSQMLESLPVIAAPNATVGVISFHSGEDRIVKKFFKDKSKQGVFRVVNLKPIVPSENELQINKKIRSAKLRLVQKI